MNNLGMTGVKDFVFFSRRTTGQWGVMPMLDSSCEKLASLSKLFLRFPNLTHSGDARTRCVGLQLQKLFTLNGVVLPTNITGSLGEYRIKTSPVVGCRPRVNARLMSETEPWRRPRNISGGFPLVVPLFSESERRG